MDLKEHLVLTLKSWAGSLPLALVILSPTQPALEHFHLWEVQNLSGQPLPVPYHIHSKELPPNVWSKPISFSLRPFLLDLSLQTVVKSLSPDFLLAPLRYWKAALRSPWSLLFSKLNNPSTFSLPSCFHRRGVPALCGLEHMWKSVIITVFEKKKEKKKNRRQNNFTENRNMECDGNLFLMFHQELATVRGAFPKMFLT